MWNEVRLKLENQLCAMLFPRLIGDPFYNGLLRRAGIALTSTDFDRLTPPQRASLKVVAGLETGLFVNAVRSNMAVEAWTLECKVLKNETLYRAADSSRPNSRDGIWWFGEEIWQRCQREARSDADQLHWLHTNLAICYDWSRCDRIIKLNTGSPGIPAIRAAGQPKTRFDSPRMFGQPLPGINVKSTIFGGLPGGLTQTVLPFIPRDFIREQRRLSLVDPSNTHRR